jgi:hypothetical protein
LCPPGLTKASTQDAEASILSQAEKPRHRRKNRLALMLIPLFYGELDLLSYARSLFMFFFFSLSHSLSNPSGSCGHQPLEVDQSRRFAVRWASLFFLSLLIVHDVVVPPGFAYPGVFGLLTWMVRADAQHCLYNVFASV